MLLLVLLVLLAFAAASNKSTSLPNLVWNLNPSTDTVSDLGRLAVAKLRELRLDHADDDIPREAFIHFLRRFLHEVTGISDQVPPEFLLAQLIAQRQEKTFSYEDCAEILSRVIEPPRSSSIEYNVYRFKRRLTLEAFFAHQDRASSLRDCPTVHVALDGGGHYYRNSRIFIGDHHTRSFTAVCAAGDQIQVKFISHELESEYSVSPIAWESAVLFALEGVEGVAKERGLKPVLSTHLCRRRMLVTHTLPFSRSLGSLTSVSVRTLGKLAAKGLTLLKAVHAKGFVHGAIGGKSFRVNKISGKMIITDFSCAFPWKGTPLRPSFYAEPLMNKSVFELEGNVPARRDDIFRFAELLLRVSGDRQFIMEVDSDPSLSSADAARLKRDRYAIPSTPHAFAAFYRDTLELTPNDEPRYDDWISTFDRL